jgi:KDO2-lipid IV(A) lauroyltransferase
MYYLVYAALYLLSLLPMRALYFLSDVVNGIVFRLMGYRRQVVMDNLLIAFPERSTEEREKIARAFYRNFTDSFVEVIKLLSASERFLQRRFSIDAEVLKKLHASGKSCQLHLGHNFNWEWGQLVLSSIIPYRLLVVYMPIRNKIFEKLFYRLRTRSGNIFLPARNMRNAMEPYLDRQYLLGLVADQNPGNLENAFWLEFFGKRTPFVSGPEKAARENDLAVVFAYIRKPRRGYYQAVVELATASASSLEPGELTALFVKYLENVIRRNPSLWLWSHRRWKHAWRPEFESQWVGPHLPPEEVPAVQTARSSPVRD